MQKAAAALLHCALDPGGKSKQNDENRLNQVFDLLINSIPTIQNVNEAKYVAFVIGMRFKSNWNENID